MTLGLRQVALSARFRLYKKHGFVPAIDSLDWQTVTTGPGSLYATEKYRR